MFELGDKVIVVSEITLFQEGEKAGVIPVGTKGEVCGRTFNIVYDGEHSIDVMFDPPHDDLEVGLYGPRANQFIEKIEISEPVE